jgi:hypothetical protein
MEISQVLAVLSFLTVFGLGWASTILITSLAFPVCSEASKRSLQTAPWKCVSAGVVAWLLVGLVAAIFISRKGTLALLGYLTLVLLLVLSAVGSAGFIRLISERIQQHGSILSPFASLTRSSFLYVLAGFVPIIGWFVITPVAAIVSAGAGWRAIRSRPQPPAAASASGNGIGLDLVGAAGATTSPGFQTPAGFQTAAGPHVSNGNQPSALFQSPSQASEGERSSPPAGTGSPGSGA